MIMKKSQSHGSEDIEDLLNESDLCKELYAAILKDWGSYDLSSKDVLNKWINKIEINGIYYVYFYVVKKIFLTDKEKSYIEKYSISMRDFYFLKQFDISLEEIPLMLEKGVNVLEYVFLENIKKAPPETQAALYEALTLYVKLHNKIKNKSVK